MKAGHERLAELIEKTRVGLAAGQDPQALAERLWPEVKALVRLARAELLEEEAAGIRRWQEARHKPEPGA